MHPVRVSGIGFPSGVRECLPRFGTLAMVEDYIDANLFTAYADKVSVLKG